MRLPHLSLTAAALAAAIVFAAHAQAPADHSQRVLNEDVLRGFNLDHGTDFATSVNGMPINMPSHSRGQGYTDPNFLIPELIGRVDHDKGPYFARNGNFSSAGSVDIVYRRQLDAPLLGITLGEHRYRRVLAAGSTALMDDAALLGAFEVHHNDGPWTLPERLKKNNAVLSLSIGSLQRGASLSLMGYDARWTATHPVPRRAIDRGEIGRFDAVDRSDGGSTSRFSLSGEWHDHDDDIGLQLSAFMLRHQLGLFSNLSYATASAGASLSDQFEQSDRRNVFGLRATRDWSFELMGLDARSEIGVQLRHDRARVGLFDTVARRRTGTTRDDVVRETSLGLYGELSVPWTPWLRTVAGLREEHVLFDVNSIATPGAGGHVQDLRFLPKLSLILGPWRGTEFFVNAGRGFHSNDARDATATVNPVPGLVPSIGWELGARSEALAGLQSSLALWELHSDSELVYVGDRASTEATLPSRRRGLEWNNRWMPAPWLLVDADFAWTSARFVGPTAGAANRIPGAVERVASVTVTLREWGPWSASLQGRYLGPRPLVEDNSVRAPSTLLANLRVSRKFGSQVDLTLDVFNLFDRRANDIEHFYESQLPGEAAPVLDRHIHPVEPRSLRLTMQLRF